jgi:HEAT repeat protein
VTDTSADSSLSESTGTLDWGDPSNLPVEEVRDVFLTLAKALRAYQLYDPNNPVYKRFVSNLREALLRIWESREEMEILVDEERLTWLGEEVYRNDNRSESISFLFYRDGIRDLTFRKGLEDAEMERFLDALHRARHARREGDDLVTILWDLDLQFLHYTAMDLIPEGMELPGSGGEPPPLNARAVLEGEVGEDTAEEATRAAASGEPSPPPPDLIRQDDFNPTLYALDDREQQYVRGEIEKERTRDLRTDVLRALFDRLEEPARPDRQAEIVEILRTLLPNLLGRGALSSAALVIQELRELMGRPGVLSDDAIRLSEKLLEDLSSEEVVQELVRALEDQTVASDVEELRALLRHLRARALGHLLKAAEESEVPVVRGVLREAVQGIAEVNREAVVRLLGSRDPSVAAGAVRLVGRLRINEALGTLVSLLKGGDPPVRKAVVETSAVFPSSVLAGALVDTLQDEDRELRIAAARVLGQSRYAPAADRFRTILNGKGIRGADVTEKVAFFEAYGMLTGEEGTTYLEKILNHKGFLGRREPPEMRAGAALALGKIGTPTARAALQQARDDAEPVVRSAVGRALRGETEGGKEASRVG